jgi:signal peptidase I
MERKEIRINLLDILSTIFWIILVAVFFLKLVVFQQVTVVGKSMMPSYQDGETLLVNQIDKNFRRGQVVAIYKDNDVAKNADYFTRFHAIFYLKRIIGLPGEEIEMYKDKVIIYNQQNPEGVILEEDYIGESVREAYREENYHFPRYKIPQNQYFLLGDNRNNSTDSRLLGSSPDYAIFGQESVRFWPPTRTDIFQLPEYKLFPLDQDTRQVLNNLNSLKNRNSEIMNFVE